MLRTQGTVESNPIDSIVTIDGGVAEYIRQLVIVSPAIREIWLFGSRANGTARLDSDWDILVIGPRQVLGDLRNNQQLYRDNIDLLVVYNGNDFTSPWVEKQGSLTGWCWVVSSENETIYRGTKPIIKVDGEEEFNVKAMQCKAYRLFP